MLIWLGKQHLGQRDKQSVETSGPGDGPICVKAEDLTDDELAAIVRGENGKSEMLEEVEMEK